LRAGAGRTKTFIVGDPNQAICGSLSSDAVPVADFRAEIGIPIREMALTRNYRSSKRIISHFSNFNVYPTSIESVGSNASFPSKVSYNQHVTLTNLHDELVRLIQASLAAVGQFGVDANIQQVTQVPGYTARPMLAGL